MATCLICWGGRDGLAVTASSTTDLFTLAAHGIRDGAPMPLRFLSGTLPTVASGDALDTSTTYYGKYISATTFELYREIGLTTKLDLTSNGTSLVLWSAYFATLSVDEKARYGAAGSERVYSGIRAAQTARASAPASTETELWEIAGAYDDTAATGVAISTPAASHTIKPEVNGTKTDAWHGGAAGYGTGYKFVCSGSGAAALAMGTQFAIDANGNNMTVQDITVEHTSGGGGIAVAVAGFNNTFQRCFVVGSNNAANNCGGIYVQNQSNKALDNIVLRFRGTSATATYGIQYWQYASAGNIVAGNVVADCHQGFIRSGTSAPGFAKIYNNIAFGNATNWGTAPAGTNVLGGNNAGETGDAPWGSSWNITSLVSGDFTTYNSAGNAYDFTPAATTSHQVDVGVLLPEAPATDFSGLERPAYNDGGAETVDIGPSEKSLGFTRPLVRTLDLSGLVSGSQVVIYTTNTTTELLRNNSTGTTLSYDAGTSGVTVDYTILKAGYAPIRVTWVALTAESIPVSVAQQLDRAYATPSGLTFGTNAIVNVTDRVVTSLQVTTATTVQNWYSYLMDCWIDSTTNTTLKNVAFPVIPFGEASFTTINGIEFSDGATSIAFFSRDGMRYSSDAGVTATAIWSAILTLNTPAGQQVKYRQSSGGSIVNAANTGPMDQLVQIYGDATHGNFDFRGFMELRAPKVGWSQPKPDLVATYGNLVDGLFVAALEPVLQYATTDADIDAANLALDNTAKTYTVTAAHTMAELYQRAQWWANQDAQWDADIPLTTTNGGTFTQPSNWTMIGVANLTGGTLAGGAATLVAGAQGIAYSGVTLNLGAAGTYTFTGATCTISMTPTAPSTYALSGGSFTGTMDLRNTTAHAITVEMPTGSSSTTDNNTGGTITVTYPVNVADISITSMPNAGAVPTRLQIINQTALSVAAWQATTAYALGALRKRTTGIGTENTAGLYLRCTTAGTSGGVEPTWNTTPGGTTNDGTAVWTTYKVLFYDDDPASTSYATTYTEGNEFKAGETAEIRFSEMDGATGFKDYDTTAITASSGFSVVVNEEANSVFATIGIDGSSQEGTFSPNYTNDRLLLDSNTNFSGVGAFAYYCYLLTTSEGMFNFWGGVTALDAANFRINTAILDLYFDETAGFVRQTDAVRWFRDDGLRPALDPTTGGAGIEINWQVPVSVVAAGSGLSPAQDAQLMALTNAPSAATVAGAVRTELTVELANLDAPVSGATAPSAAAVATQVRTELTTELGRIDAAVSSRLADASYTVAPTASVVADAVAAKTMGARTLAAHVQAQSAALLGETSGAGTGHLTFSDGTVTVEADVPLSGVDGDRTNVVIGGV